ncbi:hypothetical protein [Sinorhizobium chiapasense]|uniref:Uncharacterized protein n=1 Tax=Sinorhizobium chiapasense TaxID=501572 RepID=A0ABZ2BMB2_9HYPH
MARLGMVAVHQARPSIADLGLETLADELGETPPTIVWGADVSRGHGAGARREVVVAILVTG